MISNAFNMRSKSSPAPEANAVEGPCSISPGRGPTPVGRPAPILNRRAGWFLCCLFVLGSTGRLTSYPPAPFHIFYGMLRDQYGTPINSSDAKVMLVTSSDITVKTQVNPGIEPGANYRLEVPMDAGLLSAPYQPTALRPTVPYRLKVLVGGVTYLPIEMQGNSAQLGQPGRRTHLNLTLGVDSNGDGLPDAWQRLINADLSKVRPGDNAGNGMTYLETYITGTYAVDAKMGFNLGIIGYDRGAPLLEFTAINGRSYALSGSSDLKTWTPTAFKLTSEGEGAPERLVYRANAIQKIRVQAVTPGASAPATFFRLVLQ